MKTILLFLILPLSSFSQLSLGLGLTSTGRTSAMLSLGNFYLKSIQEQADIHHDGTTEQHELTFGYILRVHQQVSILAGAGICHNNYIENKGTSTVSHGLRMNCCEIGFRYTLFERNRTTVTLTGLINSYSGVSTVVGVGYKLRSQ